MTQRRDFDLFVIGAGSGGVRAARTSARYGARVGIAESGALGGTCVNVGCVPKKLFVHAAHYGHAFEEARGYGWSSAAPQLDWRHLRDSKNREIERLNGVYRRLLREAGVALHAGRARLLDAHTVDVDGESFTADRILVATGGQPLLPQIPGHERLITSNEVFFLESLPQRAVVVGGGYIAVEFAGIFRGLGVATTLVHRSELFLRGFDLELRRCLSTQMAQQGIALRFGTEVESVDRGLDALELTLSDGSRLFTDLVLCAVGRRPDTAGLGLEAVGVELTDAGAIRVDDDLRTSVPSIFALGDVIDRVRLTPVAIAEAMSFARSQFGGQSMRVDYSLIPTAVFSQPGLASVGLTEEGARDCGLDVRIYAARFTPLRHALTRSGSESLLKLVVDAKTDRVLGAHMLGDDAAEIIQGLAVALRAGATKATFDATIGIHPTVAEEFVTMREPVR